MSLSAVSSQNNTNNTNTANNNFERIYITSSWKLTVQDSRYISNNTYKDVNNVSTLYVQPDGSFTDKPTPWYKEVPVWVAMSIDQEIRKLQQEYDNWTPESKNQLYNDAIRNIFNNWWNVESSNPDKTIAQWILAKLKITFTTTTTQAPVIDNTTVNNTSTNTITPQTTAKEQTIAALMAQLNWTTNITTTDTSNINDKVFSSPEWRMIQIQNPFQVIKLKKVKKISNELNKLSQDPVNAVDYLLSRTRKRWWWKLAWAVDYRLRKLSTWMWFSDDPEIIKRDLEVAKKIFIEERLSFINEKTATQEEINTKKQIIEQIDSIAKAYMMQKASVYIKNI
jgi:hypothetical protein